MLSETVGLARTLVQCAMVGRRAQLIFVHCMYVISMRGSYNAINVLYVNMYPR